LNTLKNETPFKLQLKTIMGEETKEDLSVSSGKERSDTDSKRISVNTRRNTA